MINSSQHLHHELRVQQHAVARLPPKLLLLPGEATYTQPEEGINTHTHTPHHHINKFPATTATQIRWAQMGRATEWNISHFLSKLNKDETSNRKQWQHFNYFTLRDQARWDDMGFKVYAARLNSKSEHCFCALQSSQSQFGVCLDWARLQALSVCSLTVGKSSYPEWSASCGGTIARAAEAQTFKL